MKRFAIYRKTIFKPLLFLFCVIVVPAFTQAQNNFKINQLGFYPAANKIAVLTVKADALNFYITSVNRKDTFYSGVLSEERQSAYSSTKTRIADFSSFTKQGKFIVVNGANYSYPFEIKNAVNKNAAIAVLKGYYFQRASIPLEEKYAGIWQRPGFHPDDIVYIHPSAATAQRAEGSTIATPGGWYDAGDYNKYIVNSGITMGTMLSAYEDFPGYFKLLNTNIPESADAVPDILNEAIYNLRWMLTMQDPADGGVYNKCTNASFDGMVMPGVTKEKRYVVQKGTAAALDFAAVTAQASRILQQFKKQLPGLADSCIAASHKAWQWALQHPAMTYNQDAMNKNFKPVISTGGYGDGNFNDEWLWAASELFLTTRADSFFKVVAAHVKDNVNLPNWSNVGMMGFYSFLHFKDKLPVNYTATINLMKEKLIGIADSYINKTTTNAFQTVMGQSARDFNWGSNSNAANQGMLLIKAFLLTKEKKYIDHALTNADYLLGRNATGYCFITVIGSKPTMFPHHRQSTADGIASPVPGLVAGGPNPAMQDKCKYEFTEPETAYTDNDCSYASNEIAINWNAPVVYLLNAIEALQKKAGYSKK
jgi:endoglucanase